MSCNKFEFLISKKIDNVITDDELSVLEAHLQTCPKCRKSLETFQNTRQLLLKTKVVPKQASNLKFKVKVAFSLGLINGVFLNETKVW